MKLPAAGAVIGALAMWAWIAFVNRPKVEHFTIVYRGQELTGIDRVPR
jgi:hypothetical protein